MGKKLVPDVAAEKFTEVIKDSKKREKMLAYASEILDGAHKDEQEQIVELSKKIVEIVPTKEYNYGVIISAVAIALLTFMCAAEAVMDVDGPPQEPSKVVRIH